METKFFVKSRCLSLFSLIKIDDLPFLVFTLIVVANNNWSTLFIFVALNINDLVVLNVDKLITSEFEDLPPLTVCAPDLEVLVSS